MDPSLSGSLSVLALTAASVAFFHTLLGPDHYLPFVFMGRAGSWSRSKTIVVTLLCGVGHLIGSVVLGAIGIAGGVAVSRIEGVEAVRGDVAAWGLIAFGLVYGAWGLRRALRRRAHSHVHTHGDGTVHDHDHDHLAEHAHAHAATNQGATRRLTPWVLFTVFVLGPCEPLIPLLMYPAAVESVTGVVLVTAVFGTVTLLTMVGAVIALQAGMHRLSLGPVERYAHALAGASVALCGVAIQLLGL